MRKEIIKTIVIIILIVLIIGLVVSFVLLPEYKQKIYNAGVYDGQINVIQTQMSLIQNTGEIFIINNGTVESYLISSFCGGTS